MFRCCRTVLMPNQLNDRHIVMPYYSHTVHKWLFSLIFCSVARILLMVRFCSLYCCKSFSEWVKLSQSLSMCGRWAGADLGGGCRGCEPPPLPEMTCVFLIQLVFCPKNKLCGLLVLKQSKRRVHPLLKKILDPPLVRVGRVDKTSW